MGHRDGARWTVAALVVWYATFVAVRAVGARRDERKSPFMVDYKQILRLRAEGVSQRGIADVLGCSRNTVAAVFTAADSAGVGFEQVADLGADEVRTLTGSVLDADVLAQAYADADVVFEALSPRGDMAGRVEGVFDQLLGPRA